MQKHFGLTIADNIKAERNRNRLSQFDVAEKLGITARTYMKLEADASKISIKTLVDLSELFNCKLDAFFLNANFTNRE